MYSYNEESEAGKNVEITNVSVSGTVHFRARTKDDAYVENKAVGDIAGYVDSGVVGIIMFRVLRVEMLRHSSETESCCLILNMVYLKLKGFEKCTK